EAAGAVVVGSSSRHWGSSTASSSSSTAGGGGSSFRLRRLSGCYECHMVVDPAGGGSSMRAAIFPCPDCGDVFVRAESLHLHQATRHAGTLEHSTVAPAITVTTLASCFSSLPPILLLSYPTYLATVTLLVEQNTASPVKVLS
uniref:C2H2-type domain-containing protein n=1 Tax=Aegilops tauschii subsp. strangulata TaxID=200361 RepID=A0A453DK71_AEGTS